MPTFGAADQNFHTLLYDGWIAFRKALPTFYTIRHIQFCDPAILLQGIQLKRMKEYVYKETCTWTVTEALCMITKTWKEFKWPLTGEYDSWGRKELDTTERLNWYTYMLEYFSAIKRNRLLMHAATAFPGGSVVKNPPANTGDAGSIYALGRCPEGGDGTHSSILIWKIPWTEEPGGLQSIGS